VKGVRLNCKVVDEVGHALLVEVQVLPTLKRRVYLPMSTVNQIHPAEGYVVIDRWIAERERLPFVPL
jgi:hypothetical protein